FWADITKPHTEDNNMDILLNAQTTIYSCTDKAKLITTINYLKNISEAQIKEILLEIWPSIYQRNAILCIENDNLLKFLMEQYNDINDAIDLIFEKYNPNFEPSTQITFNSDLVDLYKNYCKRIIKSWLLEWINPPAVNLESHYVYKYVYHPLDTVLDDLLQYFHLHGWRHQPPFGISSSAFNQAQEYKVTEENIISYEVINKGNEANCLQPIKNSESYYDDVCVYPWKVDTAITYTYKRHSLYLLMCEVKLPNASNCGVYNKLIRSLNDAINDFIIFFSKTAKITSKLKLLFNGQIQLILLRFNSEKLRFTWLAREAMISTSFENHDVGSMIEIYLIVKEIMKENYEVILKIIQEIERNSSQEGSIQAIEYLQEVIQPTLAVPLKCK
ncbi:38075_t:CDS:2, partial [Gigaspora margarita]